MRHRSSLEFGSDSFLDVLANIVGILIILIVIASTKLGQLPALKVAPPEPAVTDEPISIPSPVVIVKTESPALEDQPPQEIADQLTRLSSEFAKLQQEAEQLESRLVETRAREPALAAEFENRRAALENANRATRDRQRENEQLKAGVNQARIELKGLLAEFEAQEQKPPNVKEIGHKITPISQIIEGNELHFRLSRDRVSVIPLDLLVERVKSHIDRQKEWLARHRRQEGTVGPVAGYSLNYVVESRSLSPLEELRHGQGLFRISVSMWELVPEPELQTESAEQALRRGSRFTRAIEEADPNASLTFWVYPDSFGLFRKLQAEAHKAGFIVTGRPLPEGAPIAGSPNGTRSAGQ